MAEPSRSLQQQVDEWTRVLRETAKFSAPYGARAIGNCLALLHNYLTQIPPQPDRNRAKTFNGWVREVGRFPKSFFVLQEGGGYKVKRGRKGLKRQSERSAVRWRMEVSKTATTVTGELRNEASYSGWLFGPKEPGATPHQAAAHTLTGWPSVTDAWEELQPQMQAAIDEQLSAFLQKLAEPGTSGNFAEGGLTTWTTPQ